MESRFFDSANLYVSPAIPAGQISESEAQGREADGAPYYIGSFDADGTLTALTKRMTGEVQFSLRYHYDGERLIVVESCGRDGIWKIVESDSVEPN